MKLSDWPHTLTTLCGLLCLAAAGLLCVGQEPAWAGQPVVVVQGNRCELSVKWKATASYLATTSALKAAGVSFSTSKDTVIEKSGLPPTAVAIFPYNRKLKQAEISQIEVFLSRGGKVVFCFNAPPSLLRALQVRVTEVIPAKQKGQFAQVALRPDLSGAPERLSWPVSAIAAAEPLGDTQIVGNWENSQGANQARPAVLLGKRGAFLTAPPVQARRGQASRTAAFWRALVARLTGSPVATVTPTVASTAPLSVPGLGALGRFASVAALQKYLEAQAANPNLKPALTSLHQAAALLAQARAASAQGLSQQVAQLTAQATRLAQTAFWQSYPPVAGEMRGIWMSNTARPSWPEAMKSLGRANFNAVFPYMMSGGVAFYRSRVLPVHPDVASDGDFLQQAVKAAQAAQVPLHARMLNLSTIFAPASVRADLRAQGRLVVSTTGKSEDWLCPTNPRNRQMEVAAALEMCAYGVDGIQFDYLRYPGRNCCYCQRCRREFERQAGVSVANWPEDCYNGCYRGRYADWRRAQLTSLVREISTAVRRQYPGVAVSAAVFLNWEDHRETFGQDWKKWVDEGLVDFVCPMTYTENQQRYVSWVQKQMKWTGGKVPLCSGIGVYSDGHKCSGPLQVLEQIRLARAQGARGWVIFNYREDFVRDYLPWLSLGVTRGRTTFVARPTADAPAAN